MRKYPKWTDKEIQFLKKNYQTMTRQQIADTIGRSFYSVKSKARDLNLTKTTEALQALAKRPNAGQFSKGSTPINYEPIGTVKIRKDSNGRSYKWIKISAKKVHAFYNWMMLHVKVWEDVHGPTPEGMIIVFKDSDTMNCSIDNLEMISLKENMIRNSCSLNLTDKYVAMTIVGMRNAPAAELLLDETELIDAKRQQIILNRELKSYDID